MSAGWETPPLLYKKKTLRISSEGPQGWRLPTLPLGIAVPSALTGLTSLFGMGRGGSPSLLPPFVFLFLALAMVVWSGYQPVYGVRERKNIVYSCYVVNSLKFTRSTTEVSGY